MLGTTAPSALAQSAQPRVESPPAEEPAPPKPGSIGLVIAGSATLAVAQAVPIAIAADHGFANSGEWFAAPLIGPWGYLAAREGCGDENDEFTGSVCAFGNTMLIMVVVVDGLMQLGGAAMIVAGIVAPPPQPELDPRGGPRSPRKPAPTIHGAVVPARGGWVGAVAGSF